MIADRPVEAFRKIIAPHKLSPLDRALDPRLFDDAILIRQMLEAMTAIDLARHPNVSDGTFPEIHFFLVDNTGANGFAVERDGKGYIGLFHGAVMLVWDLFYRMLSHPDTLHFIGNAAREMPSPLHTQGLTTDYRELLSGRPKDFSLAQITPLDPRRGNYAAKLARIALDFLVFHEIAHIRNGHCRFRNSLTGNSFIAEYAGGKSADSSGIDPLDLQVMELDADGFATCVTFPFHTKINEFLDGTWKGNLDAEVFAWCFAVFCLFWMWGWGVDLDRLYELNYPPAACRSHSAIGLAEELVRGYAGEQAVPRIPRIANDAFRAARHATISISNGVADSEMRSFYLAKEILIHEHNEKTNERWIRLRPKLAHHSYVTLAE